MDVVVPGESAQRWELYAGTPCWIELSTTDPAKACDFYAGVFGWEYETHQHPRTGEHLIAYRDGFPVASIRAASRAHSTWRLYLATDDHAETLRHAEELGAEVVVPSNEVDGLGTKAVLKGPSGAEFGILEPSGRLRFDVGLPGTLMWAELVTIQAQRADTFFQGLFGYEFEQFGVENRSDYSVWYLGEESVLARASMIRDFITSSTWPHWLIYLGVDEALGTDELVRRALGLGGRIRVDPYDSSLGRVAVLRDPTGARFAVVDSTQALGDYGTAANYDPYDD